MSTFSINGRVINMEDGANVNVHNGNLIVGGVNIDLDSFGDAKVFNIVVQGNIESVNGEFASITVEGDAGSVKGMSGKVSVEGDVLGSVSTMSGAVKVAGGIKGNASTMSGKIVH